MNKPNERYPKQVRKWGTKKSMFSVLFPATRAKAVDVRAEKLTEELGHTVSRSMVLDDLVMRDPDLQQIEKQLNKEIADGRKGKAGSGVPLRVRNLATVSAIARIVLSAR